MNPPPKSLECPICLSVLCDPRVTSCCSGEFCEGCIQRVLKDNESCPLCRKPTFTTFKYMKLVREVNSLMVYCPQKKYGCEWKGESGKLQDHLKTDPDNKSPSQGCGYVLVSCSRQCGTQVFRHQIQEHEMDSCPTLPMEDRVTSIMKKFDALHQKLNETKRDYQKELECMKQVHQHELNKVRAELNMVKKQLPVPPFQCTMYNIQIT